MKLQVELPDELAKDMKKYPKVNWDEMISQAVQGLLHDFSILDKLKEFWGMERGPDVAPAAVPKKPAKAKADKKA